MDGLFGLLPAGEARITRPGAVVGAVARAENSAAVVAERGIFPRTRYLDTRVSCDSPLPRNYPTHFPIGTAHARYPPTSGAGRRRGAGHCRSYSTFRRYR